MTANSRTDFHITLCRPMRIMLQDTSVEFLEFDAVRNYDCDDIQMRMAFLEVSRLYLRVWPTPAPTPAYRPAPTPTPDKPARPVKMAVRLLIPVDNISGMVERAPDLKKA